MVLILYGTQTGNSELIAGEVADVLERAGIEAAVVDMADAFPEMLEQYRCLAASVCTWNDGTFPDNAVEFWQSLTEVRPDCSRLSFGIIGLGDRLYEPYYQVAAYRLADFLTELGGREVIEPFEIDGPVRRSHRRAVRKWAVRLARSLQDVADAPA